MNKKLIFSALVAGAALTSSDLSAQVSKNAGFMLNGHVQGAAIKVDEEGAESESGFGAGILAGYNFNESLGLYLGLDVAAIQPEEDDEESLALAHVDLGVRYTFGGTTSKIRPYLNAAVGGVGIGQEVEDEDGNEGTLSLSGPAFTLGGGVQYFFSPRLALDGSLQGSAGKFTTLSFDGDDVELDDEDKVEFTTARLQIGVTWHP